MKVQERPQGEEQEHKIMTRKQKAESKTQDSGQQSPSKKPKSENQHNGQPHTEDENGKTAAAAAAQFDEFCKVTKEFLSLQQMRDILEANAQDASGSDDAVVPRCLDMLFYGPMERCPVCNGLLEFTGSNYACTGRYSEWSSCTYKIKEPPRVQGETKLPESVESTNVPDVIRRTLDPKRRSPRFLADKDKPFKGMMISLSGRLSRTHHYWKTEIERHGGKVSNTIPGVTCLVVSSAERDRGGSSKVVEAMERQIPVVREEWLADSIAKQEPQPLQAYDVVSDLSVGGKGIPWDKQDPTEEALESLTAELKLYGKRSVYKDTMLLEQGAEIFEKDGIVYNCAFSLCDQGREVNHYCITQLIKVPEKHLHLYYKKGKVGDDPGAEERLEEWEDVDRAIEEFARLFEEITGNEFEPWEREKKIEKKPSKFYPIDMDDGVDVRYGGLGLRQLGVAAAHCKLEPLVANFMKVLCSQEIYRYALMEMGLDSPDLPMGMLSELHLKRCEAVLLEFVEKIKSMRETGQKAEAVWSDFSQQWFTLMHTIRPFIFRDLQEIADHAAAGFETVRDINAASRLIGDLTGATIDDPLSDVYRKIGCTVSPLERESEDFKMIQNYLESTYEPVRVGDISYGATLENIFAVEPSACPSLEEVKKLPNKMLLWCGTRSSNLMRHLHKGFLPAVCSLPVPGYMFGKAIVCSDAAAEAARYGFTAVDRPEGFLVLAVASLGEEVTELKQPLEDTKTLEEKKHGVKGLGRKKTDEKEHKTWKDEIKVPCGRLIPSGHKESPLEYNEYAVYDPKQVRIMFIVGVKYEEKDVVYDTAE
uniref:Poly [ADP-ribose] polymerase n=1 Tax=Kalanchoe fedtschenkoi TaxID=63787 RepID=A0A7N0U785_KALFE